jgi:hypothetical protein
MDKYKLKGVTNGIDASLKKRQENRTTPLVPQNRIW